MLSQAFNSLGTVIAPYLAARTLLQGGLFDEGPVTEAKIAYSLGRIDVAYVFIALLIAVLALVIWRVRHEITAAAPPPEVGTKVSSAFSSRWALAGALSIFLYVGAEVAIGSVMVNFLEQPDVLAVTAAQAGSFVSLYWLGAMVGRFIGSGLLFKLPAGPLLAGAALAAVALCLTISQITGPVAGVLAISVGLFNSIMFPVIFSLTIARSSAPQSATSGLLCMAIVGGAFVPLAFAQVADASGSRFLAFLVPMACYLVIALFGWRASRVPAVDGEAQPVSAH